MRGHSKNPAFFRAERPRRLPNVPSNEVIEKLLKATTTERDRLVLMLAYYMGLRVSEITKLKTEHVDFRRKFMEIRQAKFNKDRILPIPKFLLNALRAWIGGRRTGPVFVSPRGGGHLGTRAMAKMIKRVARAANLPEPHKYRKYHMHALRHAFATNKVRNKVPLPLVQKMMGHSSYNSTLIYVHILPEDLREAMDEL